MNNTKEINNLMEKLNKSAIYNMSLSSKELFHSNFWAWLMQQDRIGIVFINLFFKDIKSNEKIKIHREKDNFDVLIEYDNNYYIIENKFKSYPNKKQIEGYSDVAGRKLKKGVITGVIEPSFMNEMPKWDFVSYSDIGDYIEKNILPLTKGSTNTILNEYCVMIQDLNCLLETFKNINGRRLPTSESNEFKDIIESIKNIKLYDVCQKYIASEFLYCFTNNKKYEQLKKLNKKNYKLELQTELGFSNGKYIVDMFWVVNKGTAKQKKIGIQLEGNQYRRVAQVIYLGDKINKDENKNDVYKKFLKVKWFMDYDRKNNKSFFKSKTFNNTSMRDRCCSYNTIKAINDSGTNANHCHVYQYWNIDDNNNDFEIITNEVYKDLIKAFNIL